MNIDNRQDQMYLKSLTVLYVEDDDDTRTQFREFLSRPTGRLITAASGREGFEMFCAHDPDIVVTDIQMPTMDGLTMAQKIREIAPNATIIVTTAFEQTDYMMRAINIGIDKYVTKPVNSYLLFESLLQCAHRLRAEEQLKLQRQREIREEWSRHNEAVAILAKGIAHDYNNMIHAILGYAALAKMKLTPGSEESDYLDKVEECTDEASKLSQMLKIFSNDYFSSMKRGQIMECIEKALQTKLTGSGINLRCSWPKELPEIKFIDTYINLVFSGIAANAIEATPADGELRVSAQVVMITEQDLMPLDLGSYIHIQVSDTGSGITSDVLPKIFEPHFSTKKAPSQSELSLTLCRTIIMKHGGIITAESKPDAGATFHIWLPVVVFSR